MYKTAPKIALVLVLLSTSPFSTSRAALLENVPLDSWVYDVVEELHCHGHFSSLHTNVRPYTRGEIASLVLELNLSQRGGGLRLTESQLWLLHKLNQEFRAELEQLHAGKDGKADRRNRFRYGTSPVAHATLAESDSSYGRLQLRLEAGLQFGHRFVLKDRVVVDTKAEKERRYRGREWKNHLTGVLDEAYANIDLDYLHLLLGRDHLRWGPGRDDVLLVSDRIPPFDMLKAEGKLGSFKFVYFAAMLDRIRDPHGDFLARRYLSGHRLNLKLRFGVEMGISEVVLYGGEDRHPEPYYLNPLLPYYGEQHNNSTDDNILWSFDLALNMFRSKEIYFELLVDDFQYDFESEPHQTGFQVGLNWVRPVGWEGSYLNLEYTKINNWVYGQIRPWNVYTYHGYGMGSILGPDADRLSYRLLHHLTKDIDVTLLGEYGRKGEGRIEAFPTPAVPESDKFPSGVVESANRHRLILTYQPSAHLKLDLSAGYSRIQNLGNESDKDREAFIFEANLSLNLWKDRNF